MMNRYQPIPVNGMGVWLEEAELGLGLWDGEYQGLKRLWPRLVMRRAVPAGR